MRVLPDEGAIDKSFDYAVPEALGDRISVGALVRIDLHGRRLGGWVLADGVRPPDGVTPKPLSGVRGLGPDAAVIELCRWAAWRWAGRMAWFLGTASPELAVKGLPPPAPPHPPAAVIHPGPESAAVAADALAGGTAVVRIPPTAGTFPLVEAACSLGPTLVLMPSIAGAAHLARRLARTGRPVALLPRDWAKAAAGGHHVVGTRTAVFGPCPGLAAIVVLDVHDEALVSEASPTWSAVDVAEARARRAGVPCALVSPIPPLLVTDAPGRRPVAPSRSAERGGWAVLDVIDRRGDDPRTGLYSTRLVELVRRADRVVCVLNRKGRARLFACRACREVARCERCAGAVGEVAASDPPRLRCGRCSLERPRVCQACGSTLLATLQVGVARAREELEALAGRPVIEVTGDSGADVPADAEVLVGTEAVLHRVDRADAVCFLDIDQELLAPRYAAAEQALSLVVRAVRLVGPRAAGGRVLLQTRLPRHPVLLAALHGDPDRLAATERDVRAALGLPPALAVAQVAGPAAEAFVAAVAVHAGIDVVGPADGRWLVRGPDHQTLCDALAATPRPPGRLRIEVDPRRA